MTVQPISDEQLAELEEVVVRLTHGDWWVDWNGSYIEIASPSNIKSLIARLRAAEVDAKRYRWLRDKSADADGVYPMVSLTDDCGDQVSNWLFGKAVDKAVDEAMESTP
ncbi:hypothetical protein [Pseudomonas aeruginosa]|uniref:hypothetical protein n=1 Tax=Pseudomonas aeruginosa TaxID=287 RepID=UPI003ADC8EBF